MGEDVGAYGGCFGVSLGLLEEFGPERIRDTPLSESAFVGAGIGAAIGGMRPIVEIMTVNFSLLALDQIMNNAASLLHMSGGQFNVPLVIRMTTGGGRQLAAQHSHSLEGWYAHIPGIRILAPATLEDARGMLLTALEDPDPVLIFEHGSLYNLTGELPVDAGAVDIDHARRPPGRHRRHARHVRREPRQDPRRGGRSSPGTASAPRSSTCAPSGRSTTRPSSARCAGPTALVVVDEGWRTRQPRGRGQSRAIVEQAMYDLDGPVGRVCSAEVPLPYAKHLEDAALPSVERIVAATRQALEVGHG